MSSLGHLRIAALSAALTLCSCGGGGGGSSNPEPTLLSGQVDTSYGTGGRVTSTALVNAVHVMADGSVYIVESTAIRKLDPRGATVPSGEFSTVPLNTNSASRVIVGPSGEIYVGLGESITKFDGGGRLVTSYGTNGVASHGIAGEFTSVLGMVRDSADDLYVVFRSNSGTPPFVAKFDRDGRLVRSYGGAGTGLASPGLSLPFGTVLETDSSGALFLSGTTRDPTGPGELPAVAKLDPSGRLATDFGVAGVWTRANCAAASSPPIEVDASGNVLVVVNCHANGVVTTRLMKLDPAGNRFASFRDGGDRPALLGGTSATEYAGSTGGVLAVPGGAIYFSAIAMPAAFGCPDFAVVGKLDSAGAPRPDFGAGGIVRFTESWPVTRVAGLDAMGRLYVLGVTQNACPLTHPALTFALYRFGG